MKMSCVLATLVAVVMSFGSMSEAKEEIPTIVLTAKNTLTYRGVVESSKVAEMQTKLLDMSHQLDKNDVIYLVLDTPGGEVDAGMQLVDTAKSLPQKVKTITVFAASMGFYIAQSLDERFITPSGTLMSHRGTMGMQGQTPGEFETRANFIKRDFKHLDEVNSSRMGMNLKDYRKLIYNEFWIRGYDATTKNAADKQAYVRCDSTMQGQTKELLGYMFGIKIMAVMSQCPVITGILSISTEAEDEADVLAMSEAQLFAQSYQAGLEDVVHNYVMTGKLEKLLSKRIPLR